MQRYLSIDKDKICDKTVKFQQLDNEFCGTIKFNQNGELKDLSDIIPEEANEDNILVDRAYLKENDSDFIGTFNSLEELEAYEGKVDKNDYALIVEVDSSTGKRSYSRYVYTSEKVWKFQYKIDPGAQIIPTKTSELENDSGYITNDDIEGVYVKLSDMKDYAIEAINSLNDDESDISIDGILKQFFNHFLPEGEKLS